MLNLINITHPILVNGKEYPNSQEAYEQLKDFEGEITVTIVPGVMPPSAPADEVTKVQPTEYESNPVSEFKPTDDIYRVHVKQWMTEHSSPGFDFMTKWNNDVPMPMVVMKGKILQETKGMYLMDLQCEPEPSAVCFRCGRQLKHPVSVLYGIGPECGGHYGINPFNSKEELDAHMDDIREKMSKVKWVGWVIKASIKSLQKIE